MRIQHALCMLDTLGYRHTLRLYNTYYFHTATMFAVTPFGITVKYIASLFVIQEIPYLSLGPETDCTKSFYFLRFLEMEAEIIT